MLNLIVKLERVDLYGINGLDNRPEPGDIGRYVRVVAVETIDMNGLTTDPDGTGFDLPAYELAASQITDADESDLEVPVSVFTGFVMSGSDAGRKVRVADYEVEIVLANASIDPAELTDSLTL